MLPNSPESPRSNDEICVATFAVKIKCSEAHLSRFSSAPISALKTAVQQVRFHFLVRDFSLVPAPPAFALSGVAPEASASGFHAGFPREMRWAFLTGVMWP